LAWGNIYNHHALRFTPQWRLEDETEI
jgi:hypothetical protein